VTQVWQTATRQIQICWINRISCTITGFATQFPKSEVPAASFGRRRGRGSRRMECSPVPYKLYNTCVPRIESGQCTRAIWAVAPFGRLCRHSTVDRLHVDLPIQDDSTASFRSDSRIRLGSHHLQQNLVGRMRYVRAESAEAA
jgi:hypothetical protein